jgi:EmrB/QacA subfamily drug resistance transporter
VDNPVADGLEVISSNDRRWKVLIVLCVAVFAINVDTTIVNVALPTLIKQLGSSTSGLQWVVDAYNLAFAALVLAAGSLSDRFGRKGALICGLVIFGVATTAGAFGTTTGQLIMARIAMGIGAAIIFPNTLSILTNVFHDRAERAKAIGAWGATTGMAVAFGPIIGGWLLEHFWWGSVFLAMAPAAAVALVLVLFIVPPSRDPAAPKLDGPGLLLSTVAIGLLIYTIIEAPLRGWGNSGTVAGFAGAVVALVAFVLWERRVDEPMLDVQLFKNLRFSAASGAISVAFFSLFGFIFLVTMYFQLMHGYSPFSTGVRLLPVAFGMGIASGLGPTLAVKIGNKIVVGAGLGLLAGFLVWLSTSSADTSYLQTVGQMLMGSVGIGLSTAPATEAIMGVIPKAKAGVGAAVNDANRLFGGTLGVAVIGSVFVSIYVHAIATSRAAAVIPSSILAQSKASVGAALIAAHKLETTNPNAASLLTATAHHAFFDGFQVGCLVAAGVAFVGAIFVVIFLPAFPTQSTDEELAELVRVDRAKAQEVS